MPILPDHTRPFFLLFSIGTEGGIDLVDFLSD